MNEQAIGSVVKVAATGRQSGAAINGQYQWTGAVRADFHQLFLRAAADLRKRGNVPIVEQLDYFARTLKAEAEAKSVPEMRTLLMKQHAGILLTVTVAGFKVAVRRFAR